MRTCTAFTIANFKVRLPPQLPRVEQFLLIACQSQVFGPGGRGVSSSPDEFFYRHNGSASQTIFSG
jgi:hypothetical protein